MLVFVPDEIWLHADVDGKLSVFVTRLHHEPSGSMNFTNFMEGVLLIVSTGCAPGSIDGSLYSSMTFSLYVPVWIRCNHDPFGTRLFETLVEI